MNYSFRIYPQQQATMREARHRVYMTVYSLQFSNVVEFTLKNVRNCSLSMQAVEITL